MAATPGRISVQSQATTNASPDVVLKVINALAKADSTVKLTELTANSATTVGPWVLGTTLAGTQTTVYTWAQRDGQTTIGVDYTVDLAPGITADSQIPVGDSSISVRVYMDSWLVHNLATGVADLAENENQLGL